MAFKFRPKVKDLHINQWFPERRIPVPGIHSTTGALTGETHYYTLDDAGNKLSVTSGDYLVPTGKPGRYIPHSPSELAKEFDWILPNGKVLPVEILAVVQMGISLLSEIVLELPWLVETLYQAETPEETQVALERLSFFLKKTKEEKPELSEHIAILQASFTAIAIKQ